MIKISDTYRSTQEEIMDDFALQGKELELLLNDLKRVNKLLGGNAITINGLKKILTHKQSGQITIVDVGCGDGELLRQCAKFTRKKGWDCLFIGIDANEHILKTAEERSTSFPEISYKIMNVLSPKIKEISADVFLCTLFLHHFKNEQISQVLNNFMKQAKIGVVVNDLERSKIAFTLFKLFSAIFIKTRIAKHDGLVSVARGFKKNELFKISEKIAFNNQTIQWKWAFRFQWILFKK
ncbi:methyltransferase domain-containing protein [Patiriisocius marinus]|uniref:methyltransferase domain-containing protein n=1 Tax=Patiriisocius marinus TaxID=1397112 RepID=UPI00232B9865|nr:methyltransferase domain-containing protein [Patiriisocius marinus]